MSNPFKVGDKVVRLNEYHNTLMWLDCGGDDHGVYTVTGVVGLAITVAGVHDPDYTWASNQWRAAIAGQDYPAPSNGPLEYAPNTGHLDDGSSVQKHSAGPLYPCVLVWRDAKLSAAKYDVGIISPRNPEPLWFSTFDRAVAAATIIKEDLQ